MKFSAIAVFGTLILGALLFIPAGTLDWSAGWICLITMTIGFSAVTARVVQRTPSLLTRRAKAGAGTPRWDLILVALFQLLFVAILVAGGLEERLHGATLPVWLELLGIVLM